MYYRHNISRNMICKYLILVAVLLFMYICESKMHKYNDMRYITRYFFYSDCLKIRPSNYGLGFLIGHSKKKIIKCEKTMKQINTASEKVHDEQCEVIKSP